MLSCCYDVGVLCLLLAMQWVDLWSVIMAFPGHTHLGDNCIQNFYLGRYIVGYTV